MQPLHPQKSCTPSRAVILARPWFQGQHDTGIDGVVSIHDEIKVVAPPTDASSLSALHVSIAPKRVFFFQPSCNVVSSGGTTMFQEFFFFLTAPTLFLSCITFEKMNSV